MQLEEKGQILKKIFLAAFVLSMLCGGISRVGAKKHKNVKRKQFSLLETIDDDVDELRFSSCNLRKKGGGDINPPLTNNNRQ